MKKFLTLILALVLAISLFSCDNTQVNNQGENSNETSKITEPVVMSKNKRVTVSTESGGVMIAANINDGNISTLWANGACGPDINEWVVIDLGENVDLTKTVISWGACRAVDYKIEISRGGAEYTLVKDAKDAAGKTDEIAFESGTVARYVRLTMTKAEAATCNLVGVAICEIEVFGMPSEDKTLGSETAKIAATKLVDLTEENTFVTNKAYDFNYLRWCGSELNFKTTGGTVIGLVVEGTGNSNTVDLNVSVDGGEFKDITIEAGVDKNEYIIFEGLEDKPHEVRVVRDTHSRILGVKVHKAIIEDTADLVEGYTREFDCKIQILGDSITAGGLARFVDTYGFKMSDQLNAQTIYSAVAGGVVHYEKHSDNVIPDMFLATEFGGEFDYNFSFQPDIVLLSCGVNDRNPWQKNPDAQYRAQFEVNMQKSFFDFFCLIHEKIPNAKILYSTSAGMTSIEVVDRVVNKAIAQAKEKYPELVIEVIYMEPKIDVNQLDEALWHPGEQTHDRDSYVYAAKVKEMLGLN